VQRIASSTTRKVLFALYGALLVLGVAVIAWQHSGQRRSLQHETLSRLGGITGTLAAQLDGGRVTTLMGKYDARGSIIRNTQDAWYYTLHESLRKSAEAGALPNPLRVVVYDSLKQELQVVVTSAERPAFREPYEGGAVAALKALTEGPGRVRDGGELVAFDVLRDHRGRVVAAVVANEPLATLEATATARLWRNIAIAAVAYLLIGLLLFRSVGRWVKHEEDQRVNLQQVHAGVTDSIAYASKIQSALIPRPERYRELFDDFFVLNRPKDLVSGDFHWVHRVDEHTCYVAQADCTGHGLPGAMIAAVGCSLLNELVAQHPTADPATLLALLNRRMVSTLQQEGQRRGAGDGMDIALCRIDRRERELLFAGAYRPLYWMHDGQITVINGDRKPIGGSQHDPERTFTVHRVAYHPGDRIYLFSDGYVDQFGGPEKRKFMAGRFNALLMEHRHIPLALQSERLEQAFLDWKGPLEQVDDVCVLGIAV
jgi:serine phosphatase RsbU (regulator of sigma subunit)